MDKHIYSARSKLNGIVFYSNQNPMLGVQSIVLPDGTINSEPIVSILDDILGFFGGGSLKNYVLNRGIVHLMNLILIVVSLLANNFWTMFGCLYFVLFASKYFYQLIVFSFAIKLGKLRRLGRFHAAEHMAVNAYNKLGRIPKIAELKTYSRFSRDCGSKKLIWNSIYNTTISLVIFIVGPLGFWPYLIALLLTAILLVIVREKELLKGLQFLVTNKPTNIELQVAIRGLIEFEQLEENLESDYGESIILTLS